MTTNTNLLAGENTIADMPSEIVDGRRLQEMHSLSIQETKFTEWILLVAIAFLVLKKVFDKSGLINSNCVVEAENRHYCFGLDDIYTHDGTQKKINSR